MAEKQRILQRIYGVSEKCLLAPKTPLTLDNPELLRQTAISCVSFRFQHIENENMDCLLWRLCLFFIPINKPIKKTRGEKFLFKRRIVFRPSPHIIRVDTLPYAQLY